MFPLQRKRLSLTKPKGIAIPALLLFPRPLYPRRKRSPIGGVDIIPPSFNAPLEGLNKEEHVPLALKASLKLEKNEQPKWRASFTVGL